MFVTTKVMLVTLAFVYFVNYFVLAAETNIPTESDVVITTMSLNEDMKITKIKLRALNTHHDLDMKAMKKDIQRLKKEFVDIVSDKSVFNNHVDNMPNEVKYIGESEENDKELSSFEWTHRAMDDIHDDITALEGQISDIKIELSMALEERNKTESFELEMREQMKQLAEESERSKKSADFLEKNNMRLWKRIKLMESKYADSQKKIEELSTLVDTRSLRKAKRIRHNRQVQFEVQELKKMFLKLNLDNGNAFDQICIIKNNLESFRSVEKRIAVLETESNKKKTLNTEIVKLHASMLELLESVEAQEARIDKIIPDFQNEFNKLDVYVAQLNSHYDYIKSKQDVIKESVKAIAVSVSNVMQKIDDDRLLINKINKTTAHLEDQSKLHFHRLKDHISKTEATDAQKTTGDSDNSEFTPELMKELKEVQKEYNNIMNHLHPSCDAIKGKPGVYEIKPNGGSPVATFCSDGWTLMQARFDGSVDFNRKFVQYAQSFGNPNGEYWIGNEALHRITKNNCTMLRIEMMDIYDKIWMANYENIRVSSDKDGYRLSVNGFTGNASDALEYQNNMEFSTIDHDHDISNTNCAADYEGGWWFSQCQHANLNGKYILGLTWFDNRTNQWIAIKTSRMMIKKNPICIKQ